MPDVDTARLDATIYETLMRWYKDDDPQPWEPPYTENELESDGDAVKRATRAVRDALLAEGHVLYRPGLMGGPERPTLMFTLGDDA